MNILLLYQESRYSDAPGVSENYNAERLNHAIVKQAWELRARAGMPKDALYTLGVVCGIESTPGELAQLKRRVRVWIDLAKTTSWGQVYVYGIDEENDETLSKQRATFSAVHKIGTNIFVACDTESFWDRIGDLLDLPVLQQLQPSRLFIQKVHNAGHKL